MSGTETILIAMYEEPEWCVDMFNTSLDCCIRQFEKIRDAGYHLLLGCMTGVTLGCRPNLLGALPQTPQGISVRGYSPVLHRLHPPQAAPIPNPLTLLRFAH